MKQSEAPKNTPGNLSNFTFFNDDGFLKRLYSYNCVVVYKFFDETLYCASSTHTIPDFRYAIGMRKLKKEIKT